MITTTCAGTSPHATHAPHTPATDPSTSDAVAAIASAAPVFGPARIISVEHSGQAAVVELIVDAGLARRRAQSALGDRTIAADDTVLVAGSADGLYVIGVLGTPASPPATQSIHGASGAVAETDGQTLRVRNERREIIFEYDQSSQRSRLVAPIGDVEIAAPNGDINLTARGHIRATATDVDLSATRSLRLSVRAAIASGAKQATRAASSAVSLVAGAIGIAGRELDVAASSSRIRMDDCHIEGRSVHSRFSRVRVTADRVERIVGRVIERAGSIVQRVTGLLQTNAARIHTTSPGTNRIRAGRVDMQADADVKIDGDRINLG